MTDRMAQMSLNNYSPDLLIEVSHDACGTFDFFKAEEMLEMGRVATVRAFERRSQEPDH